MIICSYLIDSVCRNPFILITTQARWLDVPVFVIVDVSRVTLAAWGIFYSCFVGLRMSRLKEVSASYTLQWIIGREAWGWDDADDYLLLFPPSRPWALRAIVPCISYLYRLWNPGCPTGSASRQRGIQWAGWVSICLHVRRNDEKVGLGVWIITCYLWELGLLDGGGSTTLCIISIDSIVSRTSSCVNVFRIELTGARTDDNNITRWQELKWWQQGTGDKNLPS